MGRVGNRILSSLTYPVGRLPKMELPWSPKFTRYSKYENVDIASCRLRIITGISQDYMECGLAVDSFKLIVRDARSLTVVHRCASEIVYE